MPHAPRKHLLPVEDTLAALDETVTALSKCAVDFSARVDEDDEVIKRQRFAKRFEDAVFR